MLLAELVAGFEEAEDLALLGERAYVAAGSGKLRILDISDPANPVELGSFDPGSGPTLGVQAFGGIAYVTQGAGGVRIVDVSDPANPLLLGSFLPAGPTSSHAVLLHGDHLYVSDDAVERVRVLDVSDPTTPAEVASIQLNDPPRRSAAVDDLLLVASDRIESFDISDPSSPQPLDSLGGDFLDVAILGDRAYAVSKFLSVRAYDISDPTEMVEVARLGGLGISSFGGLSIQGHLLYTADAVLDLSDGLRYFGDLDDLPFSSPLTRLQASGGLVYGIQNPDGLVVIDPGGHAGCSFQRLH